MNDFLVMGKTHDLRDLPHELETCAYAQSVSPLREEMIEPDRQRIVVKDQGRPKFVLGEAVDAEDARVLKRFEQLKFPERRPFELATVFRGRLGSHVIEPHAPFDGIETNMCRQPILITRPFTDELPEEIIADSIDAAGMGRMPACSIA